MSYNMRMIRLLPIISPLKSMYILVHKSLNKMLMISLRIILRITFLNEITESKVVDILKTHYINFSRKAVLISTINSLYKNGCLMAPSAAMSIIVYYLAILRLQK